MRRTKANRALTFVMAAALLIGSIHGVGAKEQSKAYDAPELTLLQVGRGAAHFDFPNTHKRIFVDKCADCGNDF